jgi:acyl-CoA thioester hydrolase
MARVKIKFPAEKPLYTVTIPVRIGDVNYGGHVGNDAILSIVHEARVQLLRHWGYTELNAGGNALIMADVMIAYRGEAFYTDILTVQLYAEEIAIRSFDLLYHISTTRNDQVVEIAHAKTGMACFNYTTHQTENLKPELEHKLQGGQI